MDEGHRSAGAGADEPVGTVELDLGADQAGASIRLPAREAGVAVVRQFVTGMGNVLHLDEHACEDLKLAATEACTNAVVHAYPNGDAGWMEVDVETGEGEEVLVVVRDHGQGPPPETVLEDEQDGYGLSLIEAVTDELALGSVNGGGTEVRMRFRHARDTPEEPLDAVHSPVLRRVIAMMAAHAGFSMDRLSDAVLVAETLAAHTPGHSSDGVVRVCIEDAGSDVVMRVGPLVEGGAAALLEASRMPAYGPVLEHLADGVDADTAGDQSDEYLVVRLARRR
ncbi:MAG: ATP-binding protein [Thermoleophilaceae bacterium]